MTIPRPMRPPTAIAPVDGGDHRRPGAATLVLLLCILATAVALRVPQLGLYGYDPDELWTAEIATGRGSAHLHLPRGVAMPPPDVLDPRAAGPWCHVWTGLSEQTHPPLYYVLLRWWSDLLGSGDVPQRLFSAAASVAAVAVLFDVVRRLNGTPAATWAAGLMAIAEPQVAYGRLTRSYALLTLVALVAADVLVRIERGGVTRRRGIALAGAVLATMMTHYFSLGLLAGLFAHGLVRTTGRARRAVALAFIAAAALFALAWGPFLWQQRHLFSHADESVLFLNDSGPGHPARTVRRFLLVPATLLVGDVDQPWVPLAMAVGAVGYGVPLLLVRRRPDLLLWTAWLLGSAGLVLALDVGRQTAHLAFVRYTLLGGPAVYALVAALPARLRWRPAAHALPALAAVACVAVVPRCFRPLSTVDPHVLQRQFQPLVDRDTLFVFVATGNLEWAAGENCLMVARYFDPRPGHVALVDRPASAALLAQARGAPHVLVFTKTEDALHFVPGLTVTDRVEAQGRGMIWTMAPAGSTGP